MDLLKLVFWHGFDAELLITDSISDHFEGLGRYMCRAQCRMCVLKLVFDTVLMPNCFERTVSRTILKDLECSSSEARPRVPPRVPPTKLGMVLVQECL